MTKTKYYITNENGEEILVRTSKNEYHYYFWGRCSKTYEGCLSEKTYRINELKRAIEWYNKVLNSQKMIDKEAERYNETRGETIERLARYREADRIKIEELENEPIRELYTKA